MRDNEPAQETTFSIHEEVAGKRTRRSEPRVMTLLRVGTLIVDGERELCLIRNISPKGLMIHVYSPLAEGKQVGIEFKSGQQIAGQVKWIDGSNAGIVFDAAIDVMAMLAGDLVSQSDLKPRMPRVGVRCPASLRVGAQTYRVETRDISQGGAKIALDATLPPDAELVLSMEGFPSLHGVLRWCDDGLAGITFNAVIPWPQLVCWLKERRDIGPPRDNWRPPARREKDSS